LGLKRTTSFIDFFDFKSGLARVSEKPHRKCKAREQALDKNSLRTGNQITKIRFDNVFHHA